ncbi:MAG: CapA family protein [Oscillospiraceae bacterium]|nr:CapA family protein [Oscillospiraceae bacterium]
MNRFQSNMITLAIAAVLMAGCWISIGTSGTSPSEREKTAAKKNNSSDISYSVISAEKTEDSDAEDPASDPRDETDRSAALTARVHVVAAGDNLIHSSIYKQAARRSDSGGYDFTYLYDNVDEFIANADIAVLNQETLICNDTIEPSDYPYFNSPTALGDHMINIGFDVFTMANNHVLDWKEEGLSACLDYWDSHPEVTVLGAYRNEEDKENIRTMTSNGIDFSFLAYTESLNGLKLPDSSEMLIGDAYDVDGMVSDIKAAKKISDICIVSLHWGVEDSYVISDTQRDVAQQLADAGADVIIGTHPHVLRDIEMIERKDGGKTLCAYSLGNFVSAQSEPRNLIGGVLDFYVDCFGDEYSIDDISLIPTIQHYDASYANNRVYFYSQYTDELAAQHGVNSTSKFDMEYIDSVLDNTVSAEFLQKGSIV